MLHAGLDLSRHRLDVHVMSEDGAALKVTTPGISDLSTVALTRRPCARTDVILSVPPTGISCGMRAVGTPAVAGACYTIARQG